MKTKKLTKAEQAKQVEKRIEELFEQVGWSHDLWGAGDTLATYLKRFKEHDRFDLDSLHFELERLTELVGLFRDYR